MPSPYMQDLFEAVHNDSRFDLQVFYLEASRSDTKWDLPVLPKYARLLNGCGFDFLDARVQINFGLMGRLRRNSIVVVGGYSAFICCVAMLWLSVRRRPWVYWGEVPCVNSRGLLAGTLRWLVHQPAVRLSTTIAAVGSRAVEDYQRLARFRCPVRNVPYYCDLGPFFNIHRQEPLRGAVRFLYCGQLIHRKAVDVLIAAFSVLADQFDEVHLTLLGDGPDRSHLTNLIPTCIKERVALLGFRQQDELPTYFAEADVFVLPSHYDGWGVVVNQALGAGLPIVSTDRVGAARDLVIDGYNGFLTRAGDVQSLARAMHRFADKPDLCLQHGTASRKIARKVTLEAGVENWASTLEETRRRFANLSQSEKFR